MRAVILWLAAMLLGACGDAVEVQPASDPKATPAPTTAGVPTDAELLEAMRARMQGAISVALSDAGRGEIVWSGRDLTWYYQRGYIVKRPAQLQGFDDAVLEVGGLSLYVYDGSGWRYQRDLVTWNRYEGIPEPDADALIELVGAAPLNYMPVNLSGPPQNLRIAEPPNYEWHNATSLSFNYVVDGAQIDWPGQSLNQVTLTLRTRVYRDSVDADWRDPITPNEVEAQIHAREPKTAAELGALPRG